MLDDENVYASEVDVVSVRRVIGMVSMPAFGAGVTRRGARTERSARCHA